MIKTISEVIVGKAIWWVLLLLLAGVFLSEISLKYLMPIIPIFLAGMMGSAGLMCTLKDMFRSGIKPLKISIIMSSQFILSATVGFVIAILFFTMLLDLPELALGQVLHGSMPSEQTTPVWIKIAGGNIHLGIVTLILSTLLSPFVSPALVFVYAGTWVDFDYVVMFESMLLTVLLPIFAGSLIRSARPMVLAGHDNVFSATSVLFALPTVMIVGSLAASFLSLQSLHILLLATMASAVHFAVMLSFGFMIPKLLKWNRVDVSVSIYNLSMKEFTVTLGVIAAVGLSPDVGVPAALYGIMHMAMAPIIAKRFGSKHIQNKP